MGYTILTPLIYLIIRLNVTKITNNYKELFVAPMYNKIIENGLKVKYVLLDNNQIVFLVLLVNMKI